MIEANQTCDDQPADYECEHCTPGDSTKKNLLSACSIPVSALEHNGRTMSASDVSAGSKRSSSNTRASKKAGSTTSNLDMTNAYNGIGTTAIYPTSSRSTPMDISNNRDDMAADLVNDIVAKFDSIYTDATSLINSVKDVKKRAELYLEFLDKDAVKTMIGTMANYAEKAMNSNENLQQYHVLSKDGQSLVLKSNNNKHTSSTYDVILQAKEGCNIDPTEIYRAVVAANDIVANDWLPFNISDLRIEMMNQNDALKLMTILNTSEYAGEKITDLFEIKTVIKSNYAVKSIAIDESDMRKIKWFTKDNKIDYPLAIKTLYVPTNKNWFKEGDIENIETYKLGSQPKFVIKIMVSKDCFHRFLAHGCANRKIDLGLPRPFLFQEEVKHDACWKCMDFGHSSTRCQGAVKCRYCGASHKSLDCTQKQSPVCFRCRHEAAITQRQFLMTHDALSNACPAVKARRDVVRNNLRQKFGGNYEQ